MNPWDVLSLAERLDAHPAYTGKGVCIGFVDSGFYPHPDLMRPTKRIRSYVDVTRDEPLADEFFSAQPQSWHGTMTACCAAGSGFLSAGRYRGLAHGADLVLVKVGVGGAIRGREVAAALRVPLRYPEFGIRVLNVSVGIERDDPDAGDVVAAIREVREAGVVILAAAGNRPGAAVGLPAAAREVIAVGGADDRNTRDIADDAQWPSTHGAGLDGTHKPDLVAPAVWLAAPMLPGTLVAREGEALFHLREVLEEASVEMRWGTRERPGLDDERDSLTRIGEAIEERITRGRYIDERYQRVEGTSFAAPITAAVVAQMLEANPRLDADDVREGLVSTARLLDDVPRGAQGAGVISPRLAVEWAAKRGSSAR
jgi:serine protease AprX